MAKLSHYVSGNLYYTVELADGVYQFPIATVETSLEYTHPENQGVYDDEPTIETLQLSSDLGTTTFESEMKGSDLNRWIAKAVSNGEFTKIREVVVSE
jgi:hypothetical protein